MAPSDHPQEPALEPSHLPELIDDYRARLDAWRAQERDLARMREGVLAAADHEARAIVTTTRGSVRQILLKARRELLVLAAQVQAATGTHEQLPAGSDVAAHAIGTDPRDLRIALDAFTSARHDVRLVLDEARPDLEALSSEAAALRASLRPSEVHALNDAPPPQTTHIDFDVADAREIPIASGRHTEELPRSVSAFVTAFVVVGLAVLIGTGSWLRRSTTNDNPSTPQPVARGAEPSEPRPPVATETPLRIPSIDKPTSLSVRVEARRVSWIRATVDGRVVAERMFRAGETQQITGARDVSVRAGDGGAVFVSLNGGEASALGRAGQVITRRFAFEEAGKPVGSPAQPLIEDARVVPTERATQEEPAPPPLPADTAPRVSAAEPPATNTVPPVIAPEPPPSKAAASALPVQEEFVRAAERWLDAYYRQDRNAMAAVSDAQLSVSDDRAESERLPRALAGVRRTLDDVNLQVFGESALFTARMTERWESVVQARMTLSESFVSQMWTRRAGTWRLTDVRLVSASALNRIVR